MQLMTVVSTMLYAVGYEENAHTLDVVFNTGGIYRYTGVPAHVYAGLLQAVSKGRYMQEHVLDQYPFQRIHRQRLGRARKRRSPSV